VSEVPKIINTPSEAPLAGGVTLRAYCVDEFGNEFVTVSHTTLPVEVFESKAALIRAAIAKSYEMIGAQLVSLQRDVEAEPTVLMDTAPPPDTPRPIHLRLVAVGGKRIWSPDAAALAVDAGIDL
jgi:hypothetical protein